MSLQSSQNVRTRLVNEHLEECLPHSMAVARVFGPHITSKEKQMTLTLKALRTYTQAITYPIFLGYPPQYVVYTIW